MYKYRKTLYLLFSVLNAIVLIWLTFLLLSIPYVLPDEYVLVRTTSAIKNLVLGLEQKPDSNRFLFVNVAWDKMLVEKTEKIVMPGEKEADALEIPIGNEPITDRQKLAIFFDLLGKKPNHHKFLVVDVFFKGITEFDSLMLSKLNNLQAFLTSYHRDQNDKPEYPDLKIKYLGLSDIEKVEDKCLKFKILHNDSIKSTPLLMYEHICREKFSKGRSFDFIGKHPVLRSFILDYRIRNFDYVNTNRYAKVHLGEWLNTCLNDSTGEYSNTKEFFELTKNRIIFVGDFEDRDIHETIYGDTPGPLILLNAFLALESGDNVITFFFVFFLFVFYFTISYLTVSYNYIYPRWLLRLSPKANKEGFFAALSVYIVYFAIISVCSFMIYNIHIGVLILAFYMNFVEKLKRLIKKKYTARLQAQIN